MIDRIDYALDGALGRIPFGIRKARPRQSSFCADWDGPRLKAFARRMFPLAGMPLRELVRAWQRNGRTTVRMWLAAEETSGSRYPTPEFVEWLYYAARENCARCGIVFPEAA